jgi:hypothetical protein
MPVGELLQGTIGEKLMHDYRYGIVAENTMRNNFYAVLLC